MSQSPLKQLIGVLQLVATILQVTSESDCEGIGTIIHSMNVK